MKKQSGTHPGRSWLAVGVICTLLLASHIVLFVRPADELRFKRTCNVDGHSLTGPTLGCGGGRRSRTSLTSPGPHASGGDLIVRPMHGLTNRIRAMASAMVAARRSQRRLLIAWVPDRHCNASFEELFAPLDPRVGVVLNQGTDDVSRKTAEETGDGDNDAAPLPLCDLFLNYMADDKHVTVPTLNASIRSICVRSAYKIIADTYDPYWHGHGAGSASTEARPSRRRNEDMCGEAVRELGLSQPVRDLVTALHVPGVSVAIHVRARADLESDVPGGMADTNNETNLAAMSPTVTSAMRRSCVWPTFISPIQAALARVGGSPGSDLPGSSAGSVVVAADLPGVGAALRAQGVARVVHAIEQPDECFGAASRQTRCQQHALATIQLLAQTPIFIGSVWSAYTELVHDMQAGSQKDGKRPTMGCSPPHALAQHPPSRVMLEALAQASGRNLLNSAALRGQSAADGIPHQKMQHQDRRAPLPPGRAENASSGMGRGEMTIVMVCRDRATADHVTRMALSTAAREVVVVDWGSDPPLTLPDPGPHRGRLKLVRVQGESVFSLGRAANVAMLYATSPVVWKIDCDTDVAAAPAAALSHTAVSLDGAFFAGVDQAGNSASSDPDSSHLSGNVIVRRDTFWLVGGYDERIRTYGWDDTGLYNRLTAAGLTWQGFGADWARHLPHSNAKRAVAGADSSSHDFLVEESTQRNRLCEEKLAPWVGMARSEYVDIPHNTKWQIDCCGYGGDCAGSTQLCNESASNCEGVCAGTWTRTVSRPSDFEVFLRATYIPLEICTGVSGGIDRTSTPPWSVVLWGMLSRSSTPTTACAGAFWEAVKARKLERNGSKAKSTRVLSDTIIKVTSNETAASAGTLATECIAGWTTYPRNIECRPITEMCARTRDTGTAA